MSTKRAFVTTLAAVSLMATSVWANTGERIAQAYAVNPTNQEVDPNHVEERVTEYFHDIPVMIAIASCESSFRQYDSSGQLLVNSNPRSTASGVFQILYITHRERWSENSETDITTLDGNLAFARRLYEEAGTKPWNSSRSCWEKRIRRYEQRLALLG